MTICNLCGHSCILGPLPGVPEGGRPEEAEDFAQSDGGLLGAKVWGGYNSTPGNGEGALDDCTHYTFSICEFCLDWLFTVMVIPPQVQSIHDDRPNEVFCSAAQRVAGDEWRKAKKEFYAEAERRANARLIK